MDRRQNDNHLILALAASLMTAVPIVTLGSRAAFSVDTITATDAPDLAGVRAKIKVKVKDYQNALAELKTLAESHQHPDVYSLMGFTLRKTGDPVSALTFYMKALDFDANHKGARESLGELYAEAGQLQKARDQLAELAKLCPQGCEEREDLEQVIAHSEKK
jgi:Flp pilus assembly protein TadD